MPAQTTTTGTVQFTAAFTETISSGLIVTQTLPTSLTVSLNYSNASSGSNAIDLVVGKQLTLNASASTLDLTSITDLSGTAQNFARVRELIVQNLGSAAVKVYANSTSGVTWLPAGSTSALNVYAGTSTSVSAVGGRLFLADPWTVGAGSGQFVSTSSSKLVFDPGSGSTSVNVIIAGTSTAS